MFSFFFFLGGVVGVVVMCSSCCVRGGGCWCLENFFLSVVVVMVVQYSHDLMQLSKYCFGFIISGCNVQMYSDFSWALYIAGGVDVVVLVSFVFLKFFFVFMNKSFCIPVEDYGLAC